jgi:hypothetical protein
MSEEVNDAIEQAAIDGIKSATVDNRTVVAMDIDQQIKAAHHAAAVAAQGEAPGGFGMQFQKIKPGGCG